MAVNPEKVKDELVEAIKREYGTLIKFAEKLNISPQNLNKKLIKLSPKFIRELEKNNVPVSKIIDVSNIYQSHNRNNSGNQNILSGAGNIGMGIDTIKELEFLKQQLSLQTKLVKFLEEENTRLKTELERVGGELHECVKRSEAKQEP